MPPDGTSQWSEELEGFANALLQQLGEPGAEDPAEVEEQREEVQRFTAELQLWAAELNRGGGVPEDADPHGKPRIRARTAWAYAATAMLVRAEDAAERGEAELGWRCLTDARRMVILRLPPETEGCRRGPLRVLAAAALREAEEKLAGSWRLGAVRGAVCTSENALRPLLTADGVAYAQFVLDGHHENTHRKVRLVQEHVLRLAVTGWILTVVAVWSAPLWLSGVDGPDAYWFVFHLAFFGVMGSCVSSFSSLRAASEGKRIPEQLRDSSMMLGRPAIGAVSAIAAFVFLNAGLISLADAPDGPGWYPFMAISFIAGFSERLLVSAVEKATPK
jgi:hypothetical protein